MRTGSGPPAARTIGEARREAREYLGPFVFKCLVDAGCWIILRGVSKPHLVRRYANPEHPHRVTMTHLIERIDEFVGAGDHALLIADEHHETQSTLLRDLIAYQEHGT